MKTSEQKIFDDVAEERRRQDEKWGDPQHAPTVWLAILAEEMGEAARALLENPTNWRTELVQVAAVAIAAIKIWDEEVARGGYYTYVIETEGGLPPHRLRLRLHPGGYAIETEEGE